MSVNRVLWRHFLCQLLNEFARNFEKTKTKTKYIRQRLRQSNLFNFQLEFIYQMGMNNKTESL